MSLKTQKKRRKQFKTNYTKRIKLLKSERPRLVFRKTNKYIIVQYIISEEAKDKVIFGMDSRELLKYGWPKDSKNFKNLSASYLTGLLVAKKIKEKKLETPILDFGMIQTLHKSKPFAFIKGLIEGGVSVNCNEKAFPEESRIKGEHLKKKINFEEIKKKIEEIK